MENPFVIEQKFDKERIQVHKNGKEMKLFLEFDLTNYPYQICILFT